MALALFTVVFALGMVQKSPCVSTHWSDTDARYGKMCYSDIPYLYTGRGFAEGLWPYASTDGRYPAMEYPVLTSYLAWGAAQVSTAFGSGPAQEIRAQTEVGSLWGLEGMPGEVNLYFWVTALLLFACGLGATYFLAGASPGRPWDAALFAASPVLLLTALINWDLLAVCLTAAALWSWARGKPLLAGAMVGLGIAAKLYPLFLLGAFGVDALRRRRPEWLAFAISTACASWVAVNLVALVGGDSERWSAFWSFNSERGADLGSLWMVADHLGAAVSASTINVVSGVAFTLACAAIAALGLTAPQRPQVAQIAFLTVAAFLLVNKVYSPQYVLWLLPLAVLARPNWRDLLIWQAGEVVYFGAVWLYLGGWLEPSSGDDPTAYHLAILIRVGAQLYLAGRVAWDIWTAPPEPSVEEDLVESGGSEPGADLDLLADSGRGHP